MARWSEPTQHTSIQFQIRMVGREEEDVPRDVISFLTQDVANPHPGASPWSPTWLLKSSLHSSVHLLWYLELEMCSVLLHMLESIKKCFLH